MKDDFPIDISLSCLCAIAVEVGFIKVKADFKGSPLFLVDDVTESLYSKLITTRHCNAANKYICSKLFKGYKEEDLEEEWSSERIVEALNERILNDINLSMIDPIIPRKKNIRIKRAKELFEKSNKEIADIQKLNRIILEELYPDELKKRYIREFCEEKYKSFKQIVQDPACSIEHSDNGLDILFSAKSISQIFEIIEREFTRVKNTYVTLSEISKAAFKYDDFKETKILKSYKEHRSKKFSAFLKMIDAKKSLFFNKKDYIVSMDSVPQILELIIFPNHCYNIFINNFWDIDEFAFPKTDKNKAEQDENEKIKIEAIDILAITYEGKSLEQILKISEMDEYLSSTAMLFLIKNNVKDPDALGLFLRRHIRNISIYYLENIDTLLLTFLSSSLTPKKNFFEPLSFQSVSRESAMEQLFLEIHSKLIDYENIFTLIDLITQTEEFSSKLKPINDDTNSQYPFFFLNITKELHGNVHNINTPRDSFIYVCDLYYSLKKTSSLNDLPLEVDNTKYTKMPDLDVTQLEYYKRSYNEWLKQKLKNDSNINSTTINNYEFFLNYPGRVSGKFP